MTTFAMRRHAIGGGTAAALLVVMTACGSSSIPNTGGGANQVSLTAQNKSFQPTSLSVPANQQVTIAFMNKDSIEHSITFDDNSKSVDADGGSTQMLTFAAPASGTTISFHCKYHPTLMRGTITVGSGGGAGGSGSGSSTSSSSSGY